MGSEIRVDGVQRALAAEAAGGGREEAPVEALVDLGAGPVQQDVDHVADPRIVVGAGVVGDHVDVAGALDHALRQEEARDELLVVPGRPHGHCEALAAEPDLERLLDGELVFLGRRDPIPEADHRVRHGGSPLRDIQLQLWLRCQERHLWRPPVTSTIQGDHGPMSTAKGLRGHDAARYTRPRDIDLTAWDLGNAAPSHRRRCSAVRGEAKASTTGFPPEHLAFVRPRRPVHIGSHLSTFEVRDATSGHHAPDPVTPAQVAFHRDRVARCALDL